MTHLPSALSQTEAMMNDDNAKKAEHQESECEAFAEGLMALGYHKQDAHEIMPLIIHDLLTLPDHFREEGTVSVVTAARVIRALWREWENEARLARRLLPDENTMGS
jgi:hypothetical protein